MRDDTKAPHLGSPPSLYDPSTFARTLRSIEQYLDRIRLKGPAEISTLNVDSVNGIENLQDRVSYTPASFDVVGDLSGGSGTDQSAALQAMFDEIPAGSIVDFGSMQIYYSSNITITKDVQFTGKDWKLYGDGAYITVQGTLTERTYVSAAAAKGADSVTVNSATSLAANDLLILWKDVSKSFAPFQNHYKDGEFAEIKSVSGTTLTLKEMLKTDYSNSSSHKVFEVTPVRFESYGGTFENPTDAEFALRLIRCRDVKFQGHVRGGTSAAMSIHHCYGVELQGGSTFVLTDSDISGGTDYGLVISNSQNVYGAPDCYAFGTRHGVTMGGDGSQSGSTPCRNVIIDRWRIGNGTTGLAAADIHGWASDCYYRDCLINGTVGIGGYNVGTPGCSVVGWHSGAQRPIAFTETVGGKQDFRNMRVEFASTNAATSVVGSSTSDATGPGSCVQDVDYLIDDLTVISTSTITIIGSHLHNMTGDVQWTYSMDRLTLLGDVSSLTRILALTVSNNLSHAVVPIRAERVSQQLVNCKTALSSTVLTPTLSGTWTGCVFVLRHDSSDTQTWFAGGAAKTQLTASAQSPVANDGAALGTTALSWSDLFLASGGVINWNAGDVTVTHSGNALAFAGASSGYSFDAAVSATSYTGTWSGTEIAVAKGGTGATTAGDARTNLGLGTIATQAASNVTITGGSVTGITDLAVADGGTGASNAGDARTNLGLGTIATQAASNVSITGGSITGITDLALADGGTGASTASGARTNLEIINSTWTPTLTGVTNVDSTTAFLCHYVRIGSMVHCWGRMDVDAAATAATEVGISLPVASDFTTTDQCRGTATDNVNNAARIQSDATNNRAAFIWTATATSLRSFSFHFSYPIL